MTRDRLAVAALGVLVAAALVAGLIVVGGPSRGALEKRDNARLQDLLQLQNQVSCIRNGQPGALPATLDPTPQCDYGAPTTDPVSGQPYVYERVGEDQFRLCADFEDTSRLRRRLEPRLGDVDDDGCILFAPEPYARPRF